MGMLEQVTLEKIVSRDVEPLRAEATVAEALETMVSLSISSVVVVDADHRPAGIFTEHDSLRVVADNISGETAITDVMTKGVYTVEQSLMLHDAYGLMEDKGYRHLVVVDEEGLYVGVVSEGDFLRHIGFEHLAKYRVVKDAMNVSPLVVGKDEPIEAAAARMREHKCEYAIVLDRDHPVGIITERDIAAWLIKKSIDEIGTVSRLLRIDVNVITRDIPLHEAASQMERHGVHQLIVVDEEGALIGLLTRHDVLHALHGAYFEFLIRMIEQKNDHIGKLNERKMALRGEKEEVEKNLLKLRTLFESFPDGIVLIDSTTMLPVEFNAAAHKNLEYSPEEFAKLKISDYEVVESVEQTQKRIQKIIREGRDSFETVHRKKNGELMDVWVNVVLIQVTEHIHLIAHIRDITQIKENRDKLEQNNHFMRSILAAIPDLVWMKDTQGKYLMANPMFERLYGHKESDLLGKDDFDFVDPNLARFFQENDRKAIETGAPRMNEEYLVFADGTHEGMFDTIKTPVKRLDGSVMGVLGIARDVSERVRKNAEIARLQAMAKIGTWEWDIQSNRFSGSDEACRIFGVSAGTILKLAEVKKFFVPEDRERMVHQLVEVSKEQDKFGSLYRIQRVDGQLAWIQTHTEIYYNERKHPVKAVGIFQDITERMRHEEQMRHKDNDLNAAQALAHIGSWRFDINRNLLEWSDETYRIFGIDIGSPLTYESFISVVHPEDKELVNHAWEAAMSGSKYEVEHRIVVNGEIKWVRENARLEVNKEGKVQTGVGTVQVITERKLYEERLETLANYDSLTGLANRSFLLAHLKKSIERASREKSIIALFIFDLDRFKDINDSFGHSSGDELLQQVAKRFSQRLREGDLIARLGGDEFAVVLENLNRIEDAGRIAEEMISALAAPYKLSGGAEIHIGASAGIVIYPQHGDEAEKLLQHADAALYKAKSEGRGNYHFYTDDLTDAARKRLKCENNLRRAIENREFEVFYQPQVHIETGRIVGVEALVRWNDPERGRISPAEFIPIAEETGLIREIGEWVLNEACKQGKTWLDKGYRLTVAVNLSANQVRHQDVLKMVEDALKKSAFPADRLELEITESALMQREEETVALLHSLRALGIRLAIDDFGTGYSSLSYLKRFPIDVLKIDKSFVDDIPYEQDDMAIVSAIIAMGHALGFQILAEGTEYEAQIAFLKQKGCTMYQGYFKSPPVPAGEFEQLLQ